MGFLIVHPPSPPWVPHLGGDGRGGEEEAEPSLRTPLLHKSGSAALAALARLRRMPAECQAPGTLRRVSWPRRTTARYFAALALAEEETPPRSHGSGVMEPRFESGSVGCPRAPLPRSGRSLILTGTRDSIRLRTHVTIRPCSELRAPRPRHGPLRGVTSPHGILSWCSPGRRQHQGPASRLDHTPPASGGVSVAGDGFGPRRHLLAAGPREACPVHAFCAWSAGRHLFAGQSYCERSLGQRCTVTASRSKGTSRFSGTTSVKSSRSSHHTNPAR